MNTLERRSCGPAHPGAAILWRREVVRPWPVALARGRAAILARFVVMATVTAMAIVMAWALATPMGTRAAATSASGPVEVRVPPAAEILSRLRAGHPRLLVTSNDWVALRGRVESDPLLAGWQRALRAEAEKLLGEAPVTYEIPDGLRLLSVSRRVVRRAQLLGLQHALDGDVRWRDRLWRELEAAAAFPDWNPRHFLDTAEMTHAFAIAYDWLHAAWTPAQRAALRDAMVTKGLRPALELHRRKTGWTRARHNWNQVCNGGVAVGALALADEEPALAGELLQAALESIRLPMAEFAPDGAWAEGPGYWNYATTYNMLLLAALESALGTDFGLGAMPGVAEAGSFPLHLSGPLDRTFNYADGGEGTIRAPHLFWMARRYGMPAYAASQARLAAPDPLDVIWGDGRLVRSAPEPLPLDRHFRGADIVTLRSAWNDRGALFAGFKAGDNKANHSHLDLGTFVFDALGRRWAMDLGAENYNLPGYFGKARWTYYRLRAEGQNVLVLNPGVGGPDQNPKAAGRMVAFVSGEERSHAIADLSEAYARDARRVRRGLAMLERRRLLVQDEVELAQGSPPLDAWWFMHTAAEIEVGADGRTAILRQGDARVRAELLSPAGAVFTVRPASPLPGSPAPEGQNANQGVRKLTVHLVGARDLRLAVLLTPQRAGAGPAAPPVVRALAEW